MQANQNAEQCRGSLDAASKQATNILAGDLMRVRQFAKRSLILWALLISLIFAAQLFAQTTSTVRGQITDPSGAAVTQATVVATPAPGQTGQTKAAVVNKDGSYEIKGLAPGAYSVSALAG